MASLKCSGSKALPSRFSLLAEADSDGEEEAVAPCSCQDLVCVHTIISAEALVLAQSALKRRFWLWPETADFDNAEAWPCCCTAPVHALDIEGDESFYECSHGRWLMVNTPVEAELKPEAISWGDAWWFEEQIRLSKLSPAELAERERQRALESAAMAERHAEQLAHAAKLAAETKASFAAAQAGWEDEAKHRRGRRDSGSTHSSAHAAAGAGGGPAPRIAGKRYDRKTGLPMPCRCHAHDGVPGQIAPASSGVNKKGEKFSYPAGCQQHDDFVAGRTTVDCNFFHIGDSEWRIILAAHAKAGGKWRA